MSPLTTIIVLLTTAMFASAEDSQIQKETFPCTSYFNSSDFPCLCSFETNSTLAVNCDDVVFRGDVPILPFRLPLVSFSQKRASYQSLGAQLFTASQIPLRVLDFSENHLLRLTERVFEGLESTLIDLRLGHNALGDQLNPIFSTKELNQLKELKFLDISSNQIKGLDDNIFQANEKLQELRLENNYLESVPKVSFRFLNSLQELHLQGNYIDQLPTETFSSLRRLTFLNLTSNVITSIQPRAFSDLKKLEILLLSSNQITNIGDTTFEGLDSLIMLDLSSNLLTEVPSRQMASLTNLSMLLLASNRIQTLQAGTFQFLTTLNFLDLSRNRILNIASRVFSSLPNLQEIHLDVNLFRKLDDSIFDGLQRLEVLSLDDNMLLTVPATSLSTLGNLRALTLNYNRISSLSSDILESIQTLEEFSIQSNLLREIPAGTFRKFNSIQVLDLRGNLITEIAYDALDGIDDTLVYLDLGNNYLTQISELNVPFLEILYLSHNRLTSIDGSILSKLQQLFDLDLQSNQITTIAETAFSNLRKLQTLQLQDNLLQKLPDGIFSNLKNIKTMNLSSNRLQSIGENTFQNLQELEMVDLSSNEISNIKKNAFSSVPAVNYLNLKDNKLSTFKGDFFNSQSRLEFLDLSSNLISYLYPDSFTTHPNLKNLNLANNRLSFFPSEIIRDIKSLVSIDLHGNKLQTISDLDFAEMPLLRFLDLSNNVLQSVAETAVQNSSQLQYLNLSDNELVKIPQRLFVGIHKLNLNLSRNNLTVLPNDLFSRAHVSRLEAIDLSANKFVDAPLSALHQQYFFLEKLNLSYNQIQNIPPSGNSLVNIKKLDISANPLSKQSIHNILTIPKTVRSLNLASTNIEELSILEMPFLQKLDLSNNKINKLSAEYFQRVTQLRSLHLSYNNISNLSGEVSQIWPHLKNLHELDLSGNSIQQLNAGDFQSLTNLKTLRINDLTHLLRFEDDVLGDLSNLQVLEMSNYPKMQFLDLRSVLHDIPPLKQLSVELKTDTLTDQVHSVYSPRLRDLKITGQFLQNIATNAFAGITAPEISITLSNNTLSNILPSVFFSLPMSSVININIPQNQIHSLSPQLMTFLDERKQTFTLNGLQSNPLQCDCNMRPMARWIKDKMKSGKNPVGDLKCSSPPELQHRLILDLQPEDLICDQPTTTPVITTRTTTNERTTPPQPTSEIDNEVIFDPVTPPPPDASESGGRSSSLNTMDSMIIGIIVGVVAFVCIVIVIVCVIKLRRIQRRQRSLHGTMSLNGQCTCMMKSPPPMCQCMPHYPPHPIHPGGPPSKMLPSTPQTLSRNGFYNTPPYYVTYPESEHGRR